MSSPFDFAKSVISTKEDLYTTESIFQKEYLPFMVNKILSNTPQTALFAAAMNRYPMLDKKLQYDFYRLGIPKMSASKMWTKKEETDLNMDHVQYIAEKLSVSVPRAIELYKVIGAEAVDAELKSRGGRK